MVNCQMFSSLVATPVLLQTALHSAVRLALIAEQTLFGHEHRLDHNERRLLVQDKSQVQLAGTCLAIDLVVPALHVFVGERPTDSYPRRERYEVIHD